MSAGLQIRHPRFKSGKGLLAQTPPLHWTTSGEAAAFVVCPSASVESNTLDQALAHQAERYQEEAGRRLAVLICLAGYGHYSFVGRVIIVAIFRIVNWNLGLLG